MRVAVRPKGRNEQKKRCNDRIHSGDETTNPFDTDSKESKSSSEAIENMFASETILRHCSLSLSFLPRSIIFHCVEVMPRWAKSKMVLYAEDSDTLAPCSQGKWLLRSFHSYPAHGCSLNHHLWNSLRDPRVDEYALPLAISLSTVTQVGSCLMDRYDFARHYDTMVERTFRTQSSAYVMGMHACSRASWQSLWLVGRLKHLPCGPSH